MKILKKLLGYKQYEILVIVEIEFHGDEEHEFYYDCEKFSFTKIARNEDKAMEDIDTEVWDAVKEDYTTDFNDVKIQETEVSVYNL